jgi:hypothetical protein
MDEAGIQEAQEFNSGMGYQYCAMTIEQENASRSSSESAFLPTKFKISRGRCISLPWQRKSFLIRIVEQKV